MAKQKKKNWLLYSYLLLSVYLFAAAIYIEILNHRADGYLPRRDEYYNNDPSEGLVKWRYAPTHNLKGLALASEQYSNDYNDVSKSGFTQFPKSEETGKYDEYAKANNRLHNAVIKLGLPQYPLLALSAVMFLLCLIWLPITTSKRTLCLTISGSLLNSIAVILLLYRDYFGSLGW